MATDVSVLDGQTFAVSDDRGDFASRARAPRGFFFRDMRHLSRWDLRVDGRPLEVLLGRAVEYDEAVFVLQDRTSDGDATMSVVRRRRVGDGLCESLEITNHGRETVQVCVEMFVDADFADIFEVRSGTEPRTKVARTVDKDALVLRFRRGDFVRETHIRAGAGAQYTVGGLRFDMTLAPGTTSRHELNVSVATHHDRPQPKPSRRPNMPLTMEQWLTDAPRLATDCNALARIYRRSLTDLAALRFFPDALPGSSVPAAGLPWFMALLGRDSLIISYHCIPYVPELARNTLLALARQQAQDFDDFRDAEPGKIMHELRHAARTYVGEQPHSPYYGTADATALFIIVLDEYERWTGDHDTVSELEPVARRAIQWLERHADPAGYGFVSYASRNTETGLINHCWKDSDGSIIHPDGQLASLPRATCELQGYAYDARRRAARLARRVWHDDELARRLDRDAADLAGRFQEAFWLADDSFYALALDGEGKAVRTASSNVGHLLWSGIVPEERADAVVARLMSESMFSGWGVRTLAAGQPAYNPNGYHIGTVWPHDNAIIAEGLARYGRITEATRIAESAVEAAARLGDRLPEALTGDSRQSVGVPIPYPTACSPQGWATSTPLSLIRTMLGLTADDEGLRSDPHPPAGIRRLRLQDVPFRGSRVST